jgi:hypothetical protein
MTIYMEQVPNGVKYMKEAEKLFKETKPSSVDVLIQPWDAAFRHLELMSFKEEYWMERNELPSSARKVVKEWRAELMKGKHKDIHGTIDRVFHEHHWCHSL